MENKPKRTHYQQLLEQEVTRKQFLQALVVLVVSILGFNNLLSMIQRLGHPAEGRSAHSGKAKQGFGSTRFGA